MMRLSVLVPILALWGCSQPDEPADGVALLSPREQLIRLSVDLRGMHPTEEELQLIDENPLLYEDFVDEYLESDRFLDRLEIIFNERWLTRTGDFYSLDQSLGEEQMMGLPEGVIADTMAEEPLRLLRHVVEEDRPYSEILTADYTMANPTLARLWGIEIPDMSPEAGWQEGHYTDGRPHDGMLTMTTTWTRYPSAGLNSNRHRANQLSRMLLCEDYLSRPVAFSRTQIDALVTGDPNDVIFATPMCMSCHSSLDPLSSNFYGFWWEIDGDFKDQTTYRPEDEDMWRTMTDISPAYYGRPTTGMDELADEVADDPRFLNCGVQTIFEGLTQRQTSDADWTELARHQASFAESDQNVKELVRSIVLSHEYRADDTSDESLASRIVTVKQASPDQLAGIIEGITGYRWTFDGRDGLTTNDIGLPVLAGGIDSRYVTTPNHDPSVGVLFIQERLAQSAAWHVVQHDLDPERTDEAIMLKYVNIEDTPESNPTAFDGQIRQLYLQATGIALPEDAQEPEELKALWKQLYSVEGSSQQAWAGVVSVVLRDPRVLFY